MANIIKVGGGVASGSKIIEGVVGVTEKTNSIYENGILKDGVTLSGFFGSEVITMLDDYINVKYPTAINSVGLFLTNPNIDRNYEVYVDYESVNINNGVINQYYNPNGVWQTTVNGLSVGRHQYNVLFDTTVSGTPTSERIAIIPVNSTNIENLEFNLYTVKQVFNITQITCKPFKLGDIIHFTLSNELDVSNGLEVNGKTYQIDGKDTLSGEVYIQFDGVQFHTIGGSDSGWKVSKTATFSGSNSTTQKASTSGTMYVTIPTSNIDLNKSIIYISNSSMSISYDGDIMLLNSCTVSGGNVTIGIKWQHSATRYNHTYKSTIEITCIEFENVKTLTRSTSTVANTLCKIGKNVLRLPYNYVYVVNGYGEYTNSSSMFNFTFNDTDNSVDVSRNALQTANFCIVNILTF